MTRKTLAAAALLAFCAAALYAYRPYGQKTRSEAAWMTVSSIKTGQEFYLEVDQDGKALMREETPSSLMIRRGGIKQMFVKDFFREIQKSEIINSQNIGQSKMVFYRGELLKISAYVSGELTRTEAPLNKFGEAFSYAFGEVKKAVAGLPEEKGLRAFLRAEPVTGEALESFRARAAEDGDVKIIETQELQKLKPLMTALKEPHRLIPIETDQTLKELQAFVAEKKLYGLRTLFYVPSTRGTFKCQVLGAEPKQAPPPARKSPGTNKGKGAATRPRTAP